MTDAETTLNADEVGAKEALLMSSVVLLIGTRTGLRLDPGVDPPGSLPCVFPLLADEDR
ncbi:MAG: hypothetical protein ACR2KO_00605 [Geodermatophilaceae bacterium]